MSARRTSSPESRNRRRPALPAGVDAVCDGFTVSYEIRYVDGAEGDRFAAAQADAVAALLNWVAQANDVQSSGGLLHSDEAGEERRAA